MTQNDTDYEELTKTLTYNFNILADEVQLLSDRKTILEHKLRFAHEQYQSLADKYAHGDAQISSTLAKLQLPQDLQPSTPDRAGFVPLPQPGQTLSKQQTAVAIRDGRRAAQRIAQLGGKSIGSTTSGKSVSGSSSNVRYSAQRTSLSTVLEQDFTVQGRKGSLHCPFSRPAPLDGTKMGVQSTSGSGNPVSGQPLTSPLAVDTTPHHSQDPICAAMYAETTASAPSVTGSAAKCPIRFLDQHSPEEVAAYFETHKHEIPRSHEICVRRYQRNESDIRKLDAKYGNLVNMIQGLGQKHQPMLPSKEEEDSAELEHSSNERVENWAQAVSADGVESEAHEHVDEEESDRESRFDRPMKEIRVGESPSRPWGISVPIIEPPDDQRPVSPSPAPVSMSHMPKSGTGKCPFGHGQAIEEKPTPYEDEARPVGKCPFGHGPAVKEENEKGFASLSDAHIEERPESNHQQLPAVQASAAPQPTFINPSDARVRAGPQMIFTGPVFIGYPIEEAMAFMQQYKNT